MNVQTAKVQTITSVWDQCRRVLGPVMPRLGVSERKFMLGLGDLALLNGSLLVVTILWHVVEPSVGSIVAYAKWFVTLSIVWWGFSAVFDLYNLALSSSTTGILRNASLATLLTTGVYLFIPWLTPTLVARTYVFVFVALAEVAVVGWRIAYAQAFHRSSFRRKALVIGDSPTAQELVRELNMIRLADDANPFRGTGYEVIGLVTTETDPPAAGKGNSIGHVSQLARLVRAHHVDELIVATDDMRALGPEAFEVLLDCREVGLKISSVLEVYERLTARLPIEYARYDLQALWDRMDQPSARLYSAARSLMDLLCALLGLIAIAAVLPWVALANALGSPGPLFYQQTRVGKGGRPFMVIKFRSMAVNAEGTTGAMWSADNDPRITLVGRLLRKTRLDELPQVLNVLRGEMSIIGPRPERPHFVGKLTQQIPLYRMRHAVKPGLTGWAQIHLPYADSIEDSRDKLEYDLYYIKHAGFYMDLLITLQTLSVMLQLKGK